MRVHFFGRFHLHGALHGFARDQCRWLQQVQAEHAGRAAAWQEVSAGAWHTGRQCALPAGHDIGQESGATRHTVQADRKTNNLKYISSRLVTDLHSLQSYADEDHGLANVRPHLYHSLDRFFGECFASSRLMKSAK